MLTDRDIGERPIIKTNEGDDTCRVFEFNSYAKFSRRVWE